MPRTLTNTSIRVQRHFGDDPAVVAVAGEVDLATAPELRDALNDGLEAVTDVLWLDLGATTFMDSTGLHAVFDGNERANALGRRLAIACPPGPVRRLFDITGYSASLAVHDAVPSER